MEGGFESGRRSDSGARVSRDHGQQVKGSLTRPMKTTGTRFCGCKRQVIRIGSVEFHEQNDGMSEYAMHSRKARIEMCIAGDQAEAGDNMLQVESQDEQEETTRR